MHNLILTMSYTVFEDKIPNENAQPVSLCFNLEDAIPIKRYLPADKCWYAKYKLCLNTIFLIPTSIGYCLLFKLKDYGIMNFHEIAFRVTGSGFSTVNPQIYHTVYYDRADCIDLFFPVKEFVSLEKINLSLIAASYIEHNQIDYTVEQPVSLVQEIEKQLTSIEKQREMHTKFLDYTINPYLQKKIPYVNAFLCDAWKAYPEAVLFFNFVNLQCDKLEDLINHLPSTINSIDISTPNTHNLLFIPIPCSYSQKHFARLYLARNHYIAGRIISSFNMLEYQIPIDASNEPLLLCLYGSHWFSPAFFNDYKCIGDDKCTEQAILKSSPILSIIKTIQSNPLMDTPVINQSIPIKRYFSLLYSLKVWISKREAEAVTQSKSLHLSIRKSEHKLYQYIKLLCPDAIYQYRSEWLGRQSLDIFIPMYNCAIEYQGRQHYDSIKFFGGKEKLLLQKKNDSTKKQKCKNNGILLLEWSYKDKLLFSNVLDFLNNNVFSTTVDELYVKHCLAAGLPFPVSKLLTPAYYKKNQVTPKTPKCSKTSKNPYELRKYKLDGTYISSYNSVADAAKDVSVSTQQIHKAVKGISFSAGGFMWKIINAETPISSIQPLKQRPVDNTAKPIYQISSTGEILNEFDSINSAERCTGINRKSIRNVLKGCQKTAGGYYWTKK